MAEQEQSTSQGSSTQSTKLRSVINTSSKLKGCDLVHSKRKGSTADREENSSSDDNEKDLNKDQEELSNEDEEDDMEGNSKGSLNEQDSIPINPSKRPEVDCKVASRFINHAIQSKQSNISNETKRKLKQDEIEEKLENGRIEPKHHLPEIRQVIKAGGWNDEESDSSDDEDLEIFD